MVGGSQFGAVKEEPTLVNSLKSAVQNAEALVSREEKLKKEIEAKNREIQSLQEKLSEKERSEKELKELASRLKEERDGLSARLKENEAVKKENFDLKIKTCDLECAKLRAETDVDLFRSKLKELEGRVLILEKDYQLLIKAENSREPAGVEIKSDGFMNLATTETTNADKRKVSVEFVKSEVISETNVDPTGGSLLGKRTEDIVLIVDSDDECPSHESASELDKANSRKDVAENEPGARKRKLTSLTEQSVKSARLDNKSADSNDNVQIGKTKQAKVEECIPFASLGEHHSHTRLNFEPSRRSVLPQNLLGNDSSSSSSDNDPTAFFSTFRTEDFIYTTPKMRSS